MTELMLGVLAVAVAAAVVWALQWPAPAIPLVGLPILFVLVVVAELLGDRGPFA